MLNCWNEYAENRPTFPDLVREFDRMISTISDKVCISLIKINVFVVVVFVCLFLFLLQ